MIDVEVETQSALSRLADLITRSGKSAPLLQILAEDVRKWQVLVFATRGFGAWPRNDPATTRAKGHGRVLVDSGALFRSLSSVRADIISGESLTHSTGEISALMAQKGARGAPKRNPTPKPTPRVIRGWGDNMLTYLVNGRR